MTNAEMIKALRNCSDGFCSLCPYDDYELSTKECEAKLMRDAADALEAAEQRIAELEARLPKEGEWIEDDTTYCGADRANYKCSLCGKIGGTWKRGLTQDELPNYCPNCGARMRGANDEQIH